MDESTQQDNNDDKSRRVDSEVHRVEVHRSEHSGTDGGQADPFGGHRTGNRRVHIRFTRPDGKPINLLWKLFPAILIAIIFLAVILTLFVWLLPWILMAVAAGYVISLLGKLFKGK